MELTVPNKYQQRAKKRNQDNSAAVSIDGFGVDTFTANEVVTGEETPKFVQNGQKYERRRRSSESDQEKNVIEADHGPR